MTDYLKGLWARITVHWHVLAAAFIAALPSLLDYLGVVDLKPILVHFGVSDVVAGAIVGLMPFVLMFLKPILAITPSEPAE
jgi:hypothetical protein